MRKTNLGQGSQASNPSILFIYLLGANQKVIRQYVTTLIGWGYTFFAALNWSCLEKARKPVLPNLRMRRLLVKLSGFVESGQSGDRVSKYNKSCHICSARLKRF